MHSLRCWTEDAWLMTEEICFETPGRQRSSKSRRYSYWLNQTSKNVECFDKLLTGNLTISNLLSINEMRNWENYWTLSKRRRHRHSKVNRSLISTFELHANQLGQTWEAVWLLLATGFSLRFLKHDILHDPVITAAKFHVPATLQEMEPLHWEHAL